MDKYKGQDHCEHCQCKGDLLYCKSAECNIRHSWYAETLKGLYEDLDKSHNAKCDEIDKLAEQNAKMLALFREILSLSHNDSICKCRHCKVEKKIHNLIAEIEEG